MEGIRKEGILFANPEDNRTWEAHLSMQFLNKGEGKNCIILPLLVLMDNALYSALAD
jgi:hypothetical protein